MFSLRHLVPDGQDIPSIPFSLSNNNLCSVHHWVVSNESACVLISRTDYLSREDEHMSIFIGNIESYPIRKF